MTSKAKSSSSSHSSVSGVTKADFFTLGEKLRALIMNKVQSINTAQTDVTMITIMREEMIANRKEANEQIGLMKNQATDQMIANYRKEATEQMRMMQHQMNLFQTMITPLLAPSSTNTSLTNQSDSASINSESQSADTTVTQTTQHNHNTRSKQSDIPSTPSRTPPALHRLTQPTNQPTNQPFDWQSN